MSSKVQRNSLKILVKSCLTFSQILNFENLVRDPSSDLSNNVRSLNSLYK